MVVAEEGLQRLRMSWEEYLAYPDERAEWVDGEVVVSPRPALRHGATTGRVTVLLATSLPTLEVIVGSGVWLPRNRLRGPDVMVVPELWSTTWAETPPILVVEVLSPSTRTEDTVRKGPEYAEAGIGQFWVVDPDHRSIDVYANVEGRWEPLLHLDERHPTGEVVVGEHGVVAVDLEQVIPA